MYGPLRDLFVQVFGYPAGDVDIDVIGDGGRPDVTVRAPSGLIDLGGLPVKISWIVVEAKDESGCFRNEDSREDIFAEKSKYIGTNTGWFVMVDPSTLVARRVGGRDAWKDIVVSLDRPAMASSFLSELSGLRADFARSLRAIDALPGGRRGVDRGREAGPTGSVFVVANGQLALPGHAQTILLEPPRGDPTASGHLLSYSPSFGEGHRGASRGAAGVRGQILLRRAGDLRLPLAHADWPPSGRDGKARTTIVNPAF